MEVWIGREGERHGPYQEEDVRQWLRSGELSRDDLGWYAGLADWQPLAILFADALKEIPEQRLDEPTPPSPPPITPLPTTPAVAAPADYATFWQRFAAWLLDYLILGVIGALIAVPMNAYGILQQVVDAMRESADAAVINQYAAALRPFSLVLVVLGFVYYAVFEASKWQATPGKMALRLRVCDLDGKRLTLGRSAARNGVRLLNAVTSLIPFICYIAVAWTARKQGLHDLLAKTLVLNGLASDGPAVTPPGPERRHGGGSLSA
ncbi:MAG: RDD family protein [Dyella sp.]